MTRKQTKDIKFFVQTANKMLRTQELQTNLDKRQAICSLVESVLLNKHMYHGYNYFEPSVVNEDFLVLAGKETNLIQYYTDKGGSI